jgi:hypothetical protein
MSTTVKWDLAGAKKLASSKVTINSATTTTFDFGTPDDINLAANANYRPGDRVLAMLTASTTGTGDSVTWTIQDADDNAGSIGTPATAVTSAVAGALAAGTGDDFSAIAVKVQPGRPWLRVKVTSDGATDTFVTHCSVYAIPSNV